MRVSAGGGQASMVAPAMSVPQDLAVDDTHVYWSDVGDGGIYRALIDGGPATEFADALQPPGGVALYADCVYWVESGSSMPGTVRARAK
jgi:hypothetical protein